MLELSDITNKKLAKYLPLRLKYFYFLASIPFMDIFFCCRENKKYTIYIVGSAEEKREFVRTVFGSTCTDKLFNIIDAKYKSSQIKLYSIDVSISLNELVDLHSEACHGVVFLSPKHFDNLCTKPILYVCPVGIDKQIRDNGISIIIESSLSDREGLQSGFDLLLKKIDSISE